VQSCYYHSKTRRESAKFIWIQERCLIILRLELPAGTADLYLKALLVKVLAVGNQTLMNRASEQGDAVPADLITKLLSGHRWWTTQTPGENSMVVFQYSRSAGES
jgi:hypothetical protein